MNTFHSAATTSFRYSLRRSLCQAKNNIKHTRQTSTTVEGAGESQNSPQSIIIPKRIERGPTDILKALAGTVKRDYGAPHYKYHDDPFLIPTSNTAKRMFAMSQESGRKAAQWIRKEHADLFQHKVADPPIEAYFPRAVYDEKSEVNENVLQKVISQHLVSDSLTVYGLLEQQGVEVSKETRQSLLELVCFYNGQDTLEEDWIEERWFRQSLKGREKRVNTWKKGEAADRLFASLSPGDSAAYTALICGKAQFGDMDGAYRLYQEAADAGVMLPTPVFNSLISGAPIMKEGHELRWQFVEEMLATMSHQGAAPNLGTLNAILEVLSSMSHNKNSQRYATSILAEFRDMGIEASPASYYFLLLIFCQDRSNMRSAVLVNILNLLEGKSLQIQDPRDVLFFTEAMAICRYHMSDLETAYRLDKLLHTGDNYNLIGDSFKESVYYRNFFALVCQMGTLQEFMGLYDKLVPNVYVPEPGIMEEIIKTVDMNEAWELLPRMWSDLVMFEQTEREPLLNAMLAALQRSQVSDTALLERHADLAWAIWQRLENQSAGRLNRKISWTGAMLGAVLETLLRADRYTQAVDVMTCLDQRQQEVLGVPAIGSISAFLDKSIQRNEIKNAIWCIQYCSDAGFEEAINLAQKLSGSVDLKEDEQALLVKIVGRDGLKQQAAATS